MQSRLGEVSPRRMGWMRKGVEILGRRQQQSLCCPDPACEPKYASKSSPRSSIGFG